MRIKSLTTIFNLVLNELHIKQTPHIIRAPDKAHIFIPKMSIS